MISVDPKVQRIIDWRESFVTLPDSHFFELIRMYLGEIHSPFNKQKLVEQLGAFLRKEENRKTIISLLSESDILILAAVHYIKDATTQKLSDFFALSLNFARLYERLLNLEERLLIYRHADKNSGRTIISLNPALEDDLLPLLSKKILLPLPVLESKNDRVSPSLTPEKIAAFVNYIYANPSLCKADGSIKKRDTEHLSEIFGSESLELCSTLMRAFINLSLVKECDFGFEIDRERLEAFADLDEKLEYSYLCTASQGRFGRSALVNQSKLLLETADALPATGFSRRCVLRTAFLICQNEGEDVSSRLSGGRFASILSRAQEREQEEEESPERVNAAAVDNPASVMDRLVESACVTGILKEYGKDENGESVFVKGDALSDKKYPQSAGGEEPKVLNVDASFLVTVFPGLKLKSLLPLMIFMDLKRFDTAAVFEISRKSVMRAFDRGLKVRDIYSLLEKYCAYSLPESLKVSIEDWSNSYSSAALYYGYILKADKKSSVLIENNPVIAPHIAQEIADGVYLLNIKSGEEAQSLIRMSGLDFIGSVQSPEEKITGQVFPVFEVRRSSGSALLGGGTAQLRGDSSPDRNEEGGPLTTDEQRKEHFDMLRGLLEKMTVTPEQKEGLLLRINRKIILTPAQLNADSVKLEQIEANGMDYQGKVHVAESAITQNMMLELEFDDNNAPGGVAVIVGTPTGLEKNSLDTAVHLTVEPGHEERTFSLGRARNVKRIRGSVLRRQD